MTMKPHRDPVFRDRDEWRARAERAEDALDRVRALCDEHEPGYDAATGWVGPADIRAAIEGETSWALDDAEARAERAEDALDRVRALCGQPGVRGAVWTADIRAAIDPEATP